MNRIKKDQYFIEFAKTAALRSTCSRLKVGAVLVSSEEIVICTGYNGSPRGEEHCIDNECEMENGHCIRTVHAELNAIVQAARHGIKIDGCSLYLTHTPCKECFKHIVNAGIKEIVYDNEYRIWDKLKEKCNKHKITLRRIAYET